MDNYRFRFIKFLSVLIGLILILGSCEKVIDLDIPHAEPRLVIDGEICDNSENHTVRISRTNSFQDTTSFDGISGATVEILSSAGQLIRFHPAGRGIYKSSRVRGFSGNTYTLKIIYEGKTYQAKSTMPLAVKADSITFKRLSFPGSDKVFPAVNYKDDPAVQNNYRILLRINSSTAASLITDDRFNNGNNIADLIFYEGDDLKTGDKIEIDFLCIDRNVFKYFYSLSQIAGNGGPPVSPDNPVSNFDNNALGMFSAHTKSTLQATIR